MIYILIFWGACVVAVIIIFAVAIPRAQKDENVEWTALADDDFIATFGSYTLRAEQMDDDIWWWEVYHKDDPLAFWHQPNDGLHASSEQGAKTKAEKFLNQHICLNS